MKPIEITGERFTSHMNSETEKSIEQYWEDDCVIAYHKNPMSYVFIIKSARGHFIFHGSKNYFFPFYYKFFRMSGWVISDFITDFQDKLTIINEKEYSKFLKKRIIKSLTK